MNKVAFFWIDGLAESVFPSSLELAHTPTCDTLACGGIAGLYKPFVRQFDENPKTDIVIPKMCAGSNYLYPGRSALELVDAGEDLRDQERVISFRVSDSLHKLDSYSSREGRLELAAKLVRDFMDNRVFSVTRSPFSQQRNLFILRVNTSTSISDLQAKLSSNLGKYGFEINDFESNVFRNPAPLPFRSAFMGWSSGSLRGAFKLLGAEIFNNNKHPLFDYPDYERDIQQYVSLIPQILHQFDVFIFYFKETDTLSHMNKQSEKIEAIEYFDSYIGTLARLFPTDVTLVVLGDHVTNLGSPTSSYGNVPFLISNSLALSGTKEINTHITFSEQSIATASRSVLTSEELKSAICDFQS